MWKIYSQSSINRIREQAAADAIFAYKKSEASKPQAYIDIDRVREDCTVMLKFDNPHMSIFSIERMNMNDTNERTVIGYVFTGEEKPHVKEWTLYISRRQHNELVQKFATHKESNGKEDTKQTS